MRNRIALAATTSVTIIGSGIGLTALHAPGTADASSTHHHGRRHGRLESTAGHAAGADRFHLALTLRPAELRAQELAGTGVVGTFNPLSSGSRRPHQGGARVVHVPAVTAASSTPPSTTTTTTAPPPPPATTTTTTAPPPPATTTTRPAPATFVDNSVPAGDASSTATADWQCIRVHESGDVYNDPSRPSGAYGILASTWHSLGYSGWPYEAPAAVQDQAALTLYHRYGWQPWSSRYACGL